MSIEDDMITDKEEALSDVVKTSELLLNKLYWRRKTILTASQIPSFTTLDVIGQLYDIEFIKTWVKNYAEFMTSKGGKGRNDIVDIAKFNFKVQQQRHEDMLSMVRNSKR